MEDEATAEAILRIAAVPAQSNGKKNPYAVMGLPAMPKPAWAEVTARFRRLSRVLHPDKIQEPGSEDAFKELSSAYQSIKTNTSIFAMNGGGRAASSATGSNSAAGACGFRGSSNASGSARGASSKSAGGSAVPSTDPSSHLPARVKRPADGGHAGSSADGSVKRPKAARGCSGSNTDGSAAKLPKAGLAEVLEAARYVATHRFDTISVRTSDWKFKPHLIEGRISASHAKGLWQTYFIEDFVAMMREGQVDGPARGSSAPPTSHAPAGAARRDEPFGAEPAKRPQPEMIDVDQLSDDEPWHGKRSGGGSGAGAGGGAAAPAGAGRGAAQGAETGGEGGEATDAPLPSRVQLRGRRVSIYWDGERRWFDGLVIGYDSDDDIHTVRYDDLHEDLVSPQPSAHPLSRVSPARPLQRSPGSCYPAFKHPPAPPLSPCAGAPVG